MKHYTVVLLDVTDPAWMPGYLGPVTELVHKHGGKYLCRTPQIELIEGDTAPQVAVVIEWETKEGARAFYGDPDYQANKQARLAGSTGNMLLVAGHDVIND